MGKELTEPALDDRPTDTGHHKRRRVASLSYVKMEDVRHNVEKGESEMPRGRGDPRRAGADPARLGRPAMAGRTAPAAR